MEYDVVIIGSGVAGLTASIYSARAKKSVLIIEESVLGGTTATIDNIENYPGYIKISGFDLIQNMYMQAISFGVNIEYSNINSIDFDNNIIKVDNLCIKYKALIIAGGMAYKKLKVENENKFKLKGLSYCAVCDGALYKNKKVVVVTNGYSGKNSIDYLYNITSDIIVLDISDKFYDENIRAYNNVKITKLIGDDYLNAVQFEVNNESITLDCNGLFVALGKETDLSLYENYLEIEDGFLIADESMRTKYPNVFVAGDIRKKSLRQIITACADGAIAGTEAVKFLSKK